MSDLQQRTDAWLAARCGHVTASRVADIMAKTKDGKPSAGRRNYMAELLAERLTGLPGEHFCSDAMQWGIDTEAQARMAYELETGYTVAQVGFMRHPILEWFGASPDGIITSAERGLEIKCPNTYTHLDTLLNGTIKSEYIYQMQTGMAVTGYQSWDFVSYDPRLPPHLQVYIKTIERDDDMIDKIEHEVEVFLFELDSLIKKLEARV